MTKGSHARRGRRRLKVVLEAQLQKTIDGRPCGGCTACCHVLIIPELNKPFETLCQHAKGGCEIYDSRPKPCREFLCLWKIGYGTDDHRPDRCGLLFSPTGPGQPGYPGHLTYELWPGAFEENWPLLSEMSSRVVLLLMREGLPKWILGPDHLLHGMQKQVDEIRALNLQARRAREVLGS